LRKVKNAKQRHRCLAKKKAPDFSKPTAFPMMKAMLSASVSGRPDGVEGCTGASAFRQWARVRVHDLRKRLAGVGTKTACIEPDSPWENGYCESFNSKLRDEFLNGEIFCSMKEIRVLLERWRVHYNTIRPHSSPGYDHQPRRPDWLKHWGVEKSKSLRASTSPPPTAAINLEI
jgi:hypothetical protein